MSQSRQSDTLKDGYRQ